MLNGPGGLGRVLILMGAVLLVLGGLLTLGSRLPGVGRLPGDIYVQRGNFSLYFPLATSILLSIILSLLLAFFRGR